MMNKSVIIALVIATLAVGMIASTIGPNTALAVFKPNNHHTHGLHGCKCEGGQHPGGGGGGGNIG